MWAVIVLALRATVHAVAAELAGMGGLNDKFSIEPWMNEVVAPVFRSKIYEMVPSERVAVEAVFVAVPVRVMMSEEMSANTPEA